MNNKANNQCNKLMKLDDTVLMYGIYNAETLEKLIKTVYGIHNTTSSHEKLFAEKYNHSVFRIIQGLFKINIHQCTGNQSPNCIPMYQP